MEMTTDWLPFTSSARDRAASSLASHRVSRSGTSAYCAPERGHGRAYGRKADVWAAACCGVELLTGAPLAGPIWHEGDEVARRREALLRAAGERCPHPLH